MLRGSWIITEDLVGLRWKVRHRRTERLSLDSQTLLRAIVSVGQRFTHRQRRLHVYYRLKTTLLGSSFFSWENDSSTDPMLPAVLVHLKWLLVRHQELVKVEAVLLVALWHEVGSLRDLLPRRLLLQGCGQFRANRPRVDHSYASIIVCVVVHELIVEVTARRLGHIRNRVHLRVLAAREVLHLPSQTERSYLVALRYRLLIRRVQTTLHEPHMVHGGEVLLRRQEVAYDRLVWNLWCFMDSEADLRIRLWS